jgi:hypothetical protein
MSRLSPSEIDAFKRAGVGSLRAGLSGLTLRRVEKVRRGVIGVTERIFTSINRRSSLAGLRTRSPVVYTRSRVASPMTSSSSS